MLYKEYYRNGYYYWNSLWDQFLRTNMKVYSRFYKIVMQINSPKEWPSKSQTYLSISDIKKLILSSFCDCSTSERYLNNLVLFISLTLGIHIYTFVELSKHMYKKHKYDIALLKRILLLILRLLVILTGHRKRSFTLPLDSIKWILLCEIGY